MNSLHQPKNNVTLAFEASVAGGIPILKSIREGLAGNKIEWVAGIINGTTNFILTEMQEKGVTFAKALSEAQSLGYAEADPTFDIEGIDAAHKLTILAGLSFGIPMNFKDVYVEGIKALEQKIFSTQKNQAIALNYQVLLKAETKALN